MIFQGTSDDHDGHVWDLDSFEGLNLIVALRLLRHLKLEQRGQAYIVSRHLTYSIGDEVCYGKWGDGSYTSGRPAGGYRCSKDTWYKNCHDPSTFHGTSGLLEYHYGLVMSNERSSQVQYCQCFVFAGVTATIGRTLGIPTTIVTTFQSAHDTNGDRSISKFYEIDDDDTWYRLKIQIKITVWAMETAFGAFMFGMRCGFVGQIYGKTSWMECSRCDSARAFSWQIPDGPCSFILCKEKSRRLL